jgi:transcriptional regulator with GAF, ATPase, and Fis domain
METLATLVTPETYKPLSAGRAIIGDSPALRSVLSDADKVSPTGSTVLILGETGTGKELIARLIHDGSPRRERPFVRLNCAAIPSELLESELFGHEKGAFTGAIAQRIGRFEMADRGTLFLDEIGDLPLALQPKLLRVLQEQEFERLGSSRTLRIDVRLIAATHRNLTQRVARGEFRSDLYYRLNVFPISLPPLRNRRQDIPSLVSHFVDLFARRMGRRIDHVPDTTLAAFMSYSWPGNIRELQNMIERAVILSCDGVLHNPLPDCAEPVSPPSCTWGSFHDSQRAAIEQALRETGSVVGGPFGAAARLGLKRTTLIAKMKKLGIPRAVSEGNAHPRVPASEVRNWSPPESGRDYNAA